MIAFVICLLHEILQEFNVFCEHILLRLIGNVIEYTIL